MAGLDYLFQPWGHSREEDAGGVIVYRPGSFSFPLARGRDWIEFRSDGTWSDIGPGPDDRNRSIEGDWKPAGDQALELTRRADGSTRRMTIVEGSNEVLKVRWQ